MPTRRIDHLKQDLGALVDELELLGAVVLNPGVADFHCPFHRAVAGREERSPSCGIYRNQAGEYRVKCQGSSCGFSGTVWDVRAFRLGVEVDELLRRESALERGEDVEPLEPARKTHPPRQVAPAARVAKPRKIWQSPDDVERYLRERMEFGKNDDGKPIVGAEIEDTAYYPDRAADPVRLIVYRLRPKAPGAGKTFRQIHPVAGGWQFGECEKPWPLLNQALIAQAQQVLYVEGERTAKAPYLLDRLFTERTGVATTTNPFGSCEVHKDRETCKTTLVSKARFVDLSPLQGKAVTIWPDFDEAGIEHAQQLAERMQQLPKPPRMIRIVRPDLLSLGEKDDLVDFIAAQADASAEEKIKLILEAMDKASDPVGPTAELGQHFEQIISGEWKSARWPWPNMDLMADVLYPETVSLICGEEGAGKSMFLIDAARYWHEKNVRFCVYMLEKKRKFHLRRALALHVGDAHYANMRWIKENPQAARAAYHANAEWLAEFGRRIWTSSGLMPYEKLTEWIIERAQEGYKLIVIDPVAGIDRGTKKYDVDERVHSACRMAADKYGAAVLLTTHPFHGGMGRVPKMIGGQVWSQLSDSVLWISKHQPKKVKIRMMPDWPPDPDGQIIDHVVWCKKIREGSFAGAKIGFRQDLKSLRFEEVGNIEPKASKK